MSVIFTIRPRGVFTINGTHGVYYTTWDHEAGEIYRNVTLCRNDLDNGHTAVRVIISADRAGHVDIAWSHDDLTDGRITPASHDLEYELGRRWGFWEVVRDTARDLATGRIPPECGEMEIPGLPEFLNTEPDDMGQLVNRETGETLSWGEIA